MKIPRIIDLSGPNALPIPYSRYLSFIETSRKKRYECILFCRHNPVLTTGTKFKSKNLLLSISELKEKNIEVVAVKRGGDVTAHELGQLMIYVHLDLEKRNIKLSKYFTALLETCHLSIRDTWNIECEIGDENPGLFLEKNKKLLSIGIDFRKSFTAHGLAFNIENDLSTFAYIVPCGLDKVSPTSLVKENQDINLLPIFISHWQALFREFLQTN